MSKKGFTLIELLGVIMVLAIVIMLGTYSISKVLKNGKDKSFDIAIKSFETAVRDAYEECETTAALRPDAKPAFCQNHSRPENSETDTIRLNELIDNGFINPINNPWDTKEKCDGNSYIIVSREKVTSTITGQDDTSTISLNYNTCLICGEHRSKDCN